MYFTFDNGLEIRNEILGLFILCQFLLTTNILSYKMFFGVVFVLYFFSFVGGCSVNTYPTRDYPLKRSVRCTFARSQKLRRYNRSWCELACSRRSVSGEQCEVKRSAKKEKRGRGRGERGSSLPSPPLLFIAFFTSHRSPLSERLEQARCEQKP